ncbi:MAG TPA: CopD family protein, partial [Rudaea sp.]
IVFVVTWFAGLFYLPRLFIYHAETNEPAVRAQLKIMERRLMVMTHVGAALAIAFGMATLVWYQQHGAQFLQQGWLHAKLMLVGGLIFYHGYLVRLKNRFAADQVPHSPRFLRLFNEVPALFLIAIVLLVVVKPF